MQGSLLMQWAVKASIARGWVVHGLRCVLRHQANLPDGFYLLDNFILKRVFTRGSRGRLGSLFAQAVNSVCLELLNQAFDLCIARVIRMCPLQIYECHFDVACGLICPCSDQ